jgi:hypothetical protein
MRIEDLLFDLETSEGGAPVSGTGETPVSESDPSAGTLNSDTDQTDGPPDTIPYSRFKEVNDELGGLKPYRELSQLGYDADSLRQLAEFEAGFQADPVQTWLQVASNIEQLPPELKEQVKRHLDNPSSAGGSEPVTAPQEGEMPEWAKSINQKVEGLSAVETERQAREAQEANNRVLDSVIEGWKKLDEGSGMKSLDERKMLTFIVGHARSSSSPEELLTNARNEWLELREESLGDAIKPGGNAGAPRSVPGSGAPLNTQEPPKTLAEASIRAKARLEAEGA